MDGCFAFQTISDIAGVRGAISDAVCMDSPVIIIIYNKKKVNKQVHQKKLEFSTRVGTIAHQ